MSKAISVALAGIESLIDGVGRVASWVALAMIALVATDVLLRYAFSLGSVWAQELEWHLLAALIQLGLSYALQRGENVRVDLFYARFSPRLRLAVDLLSLGLMLVIALLFVQLSLAYVGQSFSIAEGSPDPGGIPYRWVVKSMIPLGFALVALQTVGELIRTLRKARTGDGAAHV